MINMMSMQTQEFGNPCRQCNGHEMTYTYSAAFGDGEGNVCGCVEFRETVIETFTDALIDAAITAETEDYFAICRKEISDTVQRIRHYDAVRAVEARNAA